MFRSSVPRCAAGCLFLVLAAHVRPAESQMMLGGPGMPGLPEPLRTQPQPQLAHATAAYAPTYVDLSPREREILAALDKPVPRWEFTDAPIRDLARAIETGLGLPVEIDLPAFDDAGLDPDIPLTGSVADVPLRTALQRLLMAADLTVMIRDDQLVLTTQDAAEMRLVIASYPLPIGAWPEEVCDLLQSVVAPDTWDCVGGMGSIRPLTTTNALIVSQTLDAHGRITALLRDAFDADLAAPAPDRTPVRVHALGDRHRIDEIAGSLVGLCNAALGNAADPRASVTAIGDRLVVRSASRPFQIYAAELIRALDGPGEPADRDEERPTEEQPTTAQRVVHPQPNLRHATDAWAPAFVGLSPGELELVEVLGRPLPPDGLHLDAAHDTPRSLAAWLTRTYEVPVQFDLQACEEVGLDLDTPIAAALDGISLLAALGRILEPLGLAGAVIDGKLTITGEERAWEEAPVAIYPLPAQASGEELVEVIQSTIAPETWDTVGGTATIRSLAVANALVVRQTLSVHRQITALLRTGFDADLGPAVVGGGVPVRIHTLRDETLLPKLEADLAGICNAALGPAGDPDASLSAVGGRLVVASRSRPFQVFAAELIRGLDGIETPPATRGGREGRDAPGPVPLVIPGNPFCWVAREVYGREDPRWLEFRDWMTAAAPDWLRSLYGAHGEAAAAWLHDRPLARRMLRPLLDAVLCGR